MMTEGLLETLAGLPTHPVQTTTYRLTSVKYMGSPLSVEGALRRGGRYNPKGVFGALYLADTPATALAEVQMLKLTEQRLIGVKGPPKVLVSIDCVLQSVVDITQPQVQQALQTNSSELKSEWLLQQQQGRMAATQRLGSVVQELGSIEGLWAPSAQLEGGVNLVVFPDRLKHGSNLRLYDPDGLISLSISV